MVVVVLYVRFDAVPPFVGSLVAILVELPLFYGSRQIRLVPSYFIPQIDGRSITVQMGKRDVEVDAQLFLRRVHVDSTSVFTCKESSGLG